MIPIRDITPTRTVPFVTYGLIVANILVFFWQLSAPAEIYDRLVFAFGLVPARVVDSPVDEAFTVVSSMFMHGGWAHLGGNMMFLYVFGDNVEDVLGHRRYLGFYLVAGLCAAIAQVMVNTSSVIPMVGASGAIAGVIGAYLLLYPMAPIQVLNPIFLLWFFLGPLLTLPAWMVAGWFFVANLVSGVAMVASASAGQGGGTAFFAHLGGFVAGLWLIRPVLAEAKRRPRQRWDSWRTGPQPARRRALSAQHRRNSPVGRRPDPWL